MKNKMTIGEALARLRKAGLIKAGAVEVHKLLAPKVVPPLTEKVRNAARVLIQRDGRCVLTFGKAWMAWSWAGYAQRVNHGKSFLGKKFPGPKTRHKAKKLPKAGQGSMDDRGALRQSQVPA